MKVAVSVVIIVVSAALLGYWFRYTCLLTLRTRTGEDRDPRLAAANWLSFTGVNEELVNGATSSGLAELEQALKRDYRLLTYLLTNASGLRFGGLTMEQHMLMLDFRLMQAVCFVTRRLYVSRARAAVLEMTEVLGHLASDMGKRSRAASRA